MNDLNTISYPNNFSWYDLSYMIGCIGRDLQKCNPINESQIISIIIFILNVAKEHHVDMNLAWTEWKSKALKKTYHFHKNKHVILNKYY